jgi:hypothetical protein
MALACLDRLAALGNYSFNAAVGESQKLEYAAPVGKAQMADFLRHLPPEATSGDIYAILQNKGR